MLKKMLLSVLALGLGFATQASAALTAADVPVADAKSDILVVFLAILGVLVVIFGYKKVMAMIGN